MPRAYAGETFIEVIPVLHEKRRLSRRAKHFLRATYSHVYYTQETTVCFKNRSSSPAGQIHSRRQGQGHTGRAHTCS